MGGQDSPIGTQESQGLRIYYAFFDGTNFAFYNEYMSPLSSAPTSATKRFALLASLAIGSALALGSGCTFDPPDSIPLNSEGGVDGGGGGGTDGGPGGAADGGEVSGETMSITFTSQPVGNVATYAPRNVIAAWIEDANGTFVQTINRQANARADNLVAWTLKSGGKNSSQPRNSGHRNLGNP